MMLAGASDSGWVAMDLDDVARTIAMLRIAGDARKARQLQANEQRRARHEQRLAETRRQD